MKTFARVIGIVAVVVALVIGASFLMMGQGIQNPLTDMVGTAKNAAANAAIDASGIKEKAENALRSNAGAIAERTGLPESTVNNMIDNLDIQSWEATDLPEGATATGSTSINYGGTKANVTTYDDPTVVTVDSNGASVTLKVPKSAQGYIPYLAYM